MQALHLNPNTNIDFTTIFDTIWSTHARPHGRETFWRILNHCLPWDYSPSRPMCARCGAPNNTMHTFHLCPDNAAILDEAQHWASTHLGKAWIGHTDAPARWNLLGTPCDQALTLSTFSFIWKRFQALAHNDPTKAPLTMLPNYIRRFCLQSAQIHHAKIKSSSSAVAQIDAKLQEFDALWNVGAWILRTPNDRVILS